MDGIDTNVSAHSTLAGFAAFGRGSLWQYVISPNREAGLSLDIFLHSWHAEIGALLDAMYAPTASRHEPVQRRLNTVQSQHLSMKTALGLMTKHEATTRQPYDLALVTRYDILYFTQLMLAPLGEAPLWLPHWCHRYPLTAQAGMLIRAACGNWPGHGEGYLVHPATTTGVDPTSRLRRSLKSREADFDFAYLDWWFVATPAIARTWQQIYDDFGTYRSALSRIADFSMWSHFYWGYHINRKLKMRRHVRFVLYEGVDFRLARHWHFGTHCMSFLGDDDGSAPADGRSGAYHGAIPVGAERSSAPLHARARGRSALAPMTASNAAEQASSAAQSAVAMASSASATALVAAGVDLNIYFRRRLTPASNGTSRAGARPPAQLALQCPFDARVRLYCPWYSPVCPARMRSAVLDAEAAAHSALRATSKLPIWRLYNDAEAADARAVERQRAADATTKA